MPRFLAPITVEQEYVTGNETISGSETILGATSGRESYWTSVSVVSGITANSANFNTLTASSAVNINLTVTGILSTTNTDKWSSSYTTVCANSTQWANTLDTTKLPLSGGVLTGGLTGTTGLFNTSLSTLTTYTAQIIFPNQGIIREESVIEGSNIVVQSNALIGNIGVFTTSLSAPKLSGTHYGDGSQLSGVIAAGGVATDSTKLPVSGGTINGNLLINGGLTALSGATFVNTTFQDTTALRIYNSGMGPALYVEQAAGSGDIATFYDADGIEVLHVGNALNPQSAGVIGIKTSTPNKTLTINGEVSASSAVWASTYYGDGSQLTNVIAAGGVATDASKLPLTGGVVSGDLTVTGILSTTNTDKWSSTYTTVCANSTQWAVTIDTTKLPLSGGVLTNGLTGTTASFTTSLSAPSLSGTHYGDGSNLSGVIASGGVATDTTKLPLTGGIIAGDLTVTGTLSTINTDKWSSTYTTVCANSTQWAVTIDTTKLPLSGGVLTNGLTGTTASFTTSLSAPSLSGTHYGDGSNLSGVIASGGVATDTTKLPLTGGIIAGDLTVTGTLSTINTDKWSSTYTTVCANSTQWAVTIDTTKLPLSGGTLTGGLSAPSLSGVYYGDGSRLTGVVASGGTATDSTKLPLSGGTINGNLLVNGGLTALSGATFINTTFQDTTALRIFNSGIGPALYVEQASGSGDIAKFYDADGIEVLHVGNALNPESAGVIGIKTSTPNKTLTINGEVSAASGVWASTYYGDGSKLTGVIASGGVATDSTKLALTGGIVAGDLTVTGTLSTVNTDKWSSTYTTVCANSTQWANTLDTTKLPLSGGVLTGPLTGTVATFTTSISTQSISGVHYGDGSRLTGISSGVTSVNGLTGAVSLNVLYLSGGTLTGAITGTVATFTTSISSPAVSGVHYGDGSKLTGISTPAGLYLPLSGGALSGTVTSVSEISSSATITANNIAAQNQVQYLATNAVKVYQYYNPTTNSLDTVFN